MDGTQFKAVKEVLKAEGYQPGAPSEQAATIDRTVCTESKCPSCGFVGMIYQPFTHPPSASYRAFATCPSCGHAQEF